MKNEKIKHIQGLLTYLNQENEKANEDLVCQYFRETFDNFTRQSDASNADGYVSGHFILEIKGHTQDWYDGLFQAIAYKKNLDFSLVVVITKGLIGVWRIDKIPENIVNEILVNNKAPNAIGKELAKKYKAQRYNFQNLAEWFRDDLFGLLAPSTKEFIEIINDFKSIVIAGKKVRKKITLKNFTSILKKMKIYFDPSQPIKVVRAFYTMIYGWNEDAIVQLSKRHEDQVTMNGELITNLIPDMRFDFKSFVEEHYIHLFDGEGIDDFFTKYDQAIDAVDSDFRKKNGIYFTDPFLSKFAMWFIKENIPNLGKNYIVVDPAAGSGNLVINWRSPLELRHKVVSEIEPELLFAIERRMKRDERQKGKFTIIPKIEQAKGLNFLDISASNYIGIINETLQEKNLKLDKPIAFLCNPPYRGDDDTSVNTISYEIHPTILDVITREAESERYCCFLAQMKLICDHLEESGFPDDSKLLLFTKSTWLTNRKSFSNLKHAIFSSFDYIDGALFDGKEFFDLKGKFPIAFTMWTYKSKKITNLTNIVGLRDLTWVKKKNLCEIDWNNYEQVNDRCNKIITDERAIKIPFGLDRFGIKEWSNIKRKDLIRSRRKSEIKDLYCGGLPKNDPRLKNNSVYGFYDGDSIGFMEDLTPCRTFAEKKDVPWFTLDARFQRIRRNRCFSGPPDSRGYCAVDYLSAKKLFLWYALAKTFVDFSAPMWTDAGSVSFFL
jgi:hypothetical protein